MPADNDTPNGPYDQLEGHDPAAEEQADTAPAVKDPPVADLTNKTPPAK